MSDHIGPERGINVTARHRAQGHEIKIHPVGLDYDEPDDLREVLSALGGIRQAVDEAIQVLRDAGVEPLNRWGL